MICLSASDFLNIVSENYAIWIKTWIGLLWFNLKRVKYIDQLITNICSTIRLGLQHWILVPDLYPYIYIHRTGTLTYTDHISYIILSGESMIHLLVSDMFIQLIILFGHLAKKSEGSKRNIIKFIALWHHWSIKLVFTDTIESHEVI